mgnify:CR=1 FL=1
MKNFDLDADVVGESSKGAGGSKKRKGKEPMLPSGHNVPNLKPGAVPYCWSLRQQG